MTMSDHAAPTCQAVVEVDGMWVRCDNPDPHETLHSSLTTRVIWGYNG